MYHPRLNSSFDIIWFVMSFNLSSANYWVLYRFQGVNCFFSLFSRKTILSFISLCWDSRWVLYRSSKLILCYRGIVFKVSRSNESRSSCPRLQVYTQKSKRWLNHVILKQQISLYMVLLNRICCFSRPWSVDLHVVSWFIPRLRGLSDHKKYKNTRLKTMRQIEEYTNFVH